VGYILHLSGLLCNIAITFYILLLTGMHIQSVQRGTANLSVLGLVAVINLRSQVGSGQEGPQPFLFVLLAGAARS
jgi:hypothetical protein